MGKAKLAPPANLPCSCVSPFVGRDRELEKLHQQLQRVDRVFIAATAGMSGVGKTELAIQYARYHWQQQSYPDGVCWLQAQGLDLGTQIVEFARSQLNLNPPEDLNLASRVAFCWQHWPTILNPQHTLSTSSLPPKVLVVLDNVSDYQAICAYLPPIGSGFKVLLVQTGQGKLPQENLNPAESSVNVLVATHFHRQEKFWQQLSLSGLTEAAAMQVLQSLMGKNRLQQELSVAKELCRLLNYLPLNLKLVGQYLKRREYLSLAIVKHRLEEKQLAAQQTLPPDATGIASRLDLIAAFELNWQVLDKPTQKLACLLSLFAAAPIPWVLVEQCLPQQEPGELGIVRDLKLIELHLLQPEGADTYSLHQPIRELLGAKLAASPWSHDLRQQFCQVMVTFIRQMPRSLTQGELAAIAPTIPHVMEVAMFFRDGLSEEDLVWPFNGLSRFYQHQGAYDQAKFWREQYLSMARHQSGKEHPNLIRSQQNLAEVNHVQKHRLDAERMRLQVLASRRQLLDEPQHQGMANSSNSQVQSQPSQGQYVEADSPNGQTLELSKRSLNEADPNIADSLKNLVEYHAQGHQAETEKLCLQILELRRCYLGDKHPDVANSFNNQAQIYQFQGRYAEAEQFYAQALDLRRRALGEEHPYVAASLSNLAEIYKLQGHYHKAEQLWIHVIGLRKRLVGTAHLDLANSLHHLAEVYKLQKRGDDAEPLCLRALELRKRFLGANHPDVIASLSHLAEIQQLKGRYAEAEKLLVRVTQLRRYLLGENHADIAHSLHTLAGLYHAQQRLSEAEALYIKALTLRRQLLGEQHLDVATSLNHLAKLYCSRQYYDRAEPLYVRSLVLRRQLLGDNHPDIAESLHNLAELYDAKRAYAQAEPLYVRSLKLKRQLLGADHPDFIEILHQLAQLYCKQGVYTKAESLYVYSLKLRRKLLGEGHPELVESLINLAQLYFSQQRYVEAELLYQLVLKSYQQVLGDNHPHVSNSCKALVELYQIQHRYIEAESIYELMLEMSERRRGRNHPETLTLHRHLENLRGLTPRLRPVAP
ncbi:MAG: tetratricopeptide repeat protein [Cyanothece sp. SIO1E1]|nr:tetratricopeptide repeat protein [Cyanothece sp. SIO1E1]